MDEKGVKLSFIAYNQFGGAKPAVVAEEIAAEHAAGRIVIVFSHWGEEYHDHSMPYQQVVAHEFVDAGADIVFGAHPHVVEEAEVYHGKQIFYSLGNFIFDQYFSDDVMHGLTVELSVAQDGTLTTQQIGVVMTPEHRTCRIPA